MPKERAPLYMADYLVFEAQRNLLLRDAGATGVLARRAGGSGTSNFADNVFYGDEAKMTAVSASISIVTQNE